VTFTIGATRVSTSSTTLFDQTSCSQLANGMTAEVNGTRQADGSVKASRVKVEVEQHNNAEVDLTGTLAGLAGTCPAITFTVNSKAVSTTASTRFKDVTCASLANGDRVEVKGAQGATSIVATEVEKK
jgi:hypothetical protein